MKGQVFKIHSDFYYVETDEGIIEAKLRDILKKQDAAIVVGDFVELERINGAQAFISKLYKRQNFIPKPKASNIDQVVIVSALKNPELNFEQLDRYLCLCEFYKIKPVLCFNKNDLIENDETSTKILEIYKKLNYETVFISALEKSGIEQLEFILKDKISVLCGMSGVGKSTILNVLYPELNLKTKPVSEKTLKGTHTTRHCEIVKVTFKDGSKCKVVDTPGFSNLKFDFILPANISDLFPEITQFKEKCKFRDCLHLNETDCGILNNLDKIAQSRYDSYCSFVKEADEYKKIVSNRGTKTETRHKKINDETVAKINSKKRADTRRKIKQNLKNANEEE